MPSRHVFLDVREETEKKQARSQDFCEGGRFEQKVDLFLFFFLSVKGGAAKTVYIYIYVFKQISD